VDLSNYNQFLDLFEKWNRSINLSAASTRAEISSHIEDSLHVVPHLRGAGAVLDVGSGGGFPVVIAAIALPEVQFVSLEPVHKKQAFLRTAARELGLANLDARAERLETHERSDYDVAMSRATFDLKDWLAMGLERVRPGGVVLGFEAQLRTDLENVERDVYSLDGKSRAIVIKTRLATLPG
jgi:16S rRNA (guanine527-N7)-methyltransferase